MTELTMEEKVAQVLLDAERLMNDSGRHWTKGHFRQKDRKTGEVTYCSVGAIREVAKGNRTLQNKAYTALVAVLPRRILRNYPFLTRDRDRVISFNDAHETDWNAVSRAFRQAAVNLRGGS